jgi:hypothetical protein
MRLSTLLDTFSYCGDSGTNQKYGSFFINVLAQTIPILTGNTSGKLLVLTGDGSSLVCARYRWRGTK